jgi:hypothetical protein
VRAGASASGKTCLHLVVEALVQLAWSSLQEDSRGLSLLREFIFTPGLLIGAFFPVRLSRFRAASFRLVL